MELTLSPYFITFGSSKVHPFGLNDYVMVYAPTEYIAREVFAYYHPNKESDGYAFAFIYSEPEWYEEKNGRATCDYYENTDPIRIYYFDEKTHGKWLASKEAERG